MSSTWSCYTATNAEVLADLIRRSRQLIGGIGTTGSGVFRSRGNLTLYFSPGATDLSCR